MEGVSSRPEYASVIGKTFKTTQDLMAIGVTLDRNYKKQVDYILLFPKPGLIGREVVTTEELSKGSTIRVVKVLDRKGIPIPIVSPRKYVVELMGDKKLKVNAPILVKRNGSVDDGNFGFDKEIYEKVE